MSPPSGAEKPLAYTSLCLSTVAIIWKAWGKFPLIPGWDTIFEDSPDALYPRRTGNSSAWNLLYFAMYGILGTVGQYAGLQLTLDEDQRKEHVNEMSQRRARLLGLFHTTIGVHHTLWAIFKSYGRLDLTKFDLPGGNLIPGAVGAWTGWHGWKLLNTKEGSRFDKVVRHKTIVDAVSLMSLIEVMGFFPAMWMGYERDNKFEGTMYALTFGVPFVMLTADAVRALKKGKDETKKAN